MNNDEKCKIMINKASQFLTELNELMKKYGFSIETMISEKKEPLNENEKTLIKWYKDQGGILITTGGKSWSDNGAILTNKWIPGYTAELHFTGTYKEDKEEQNVIDKGLLTVEEVRKLTTDITKVCDKLEDIQKELKGRIK